jgi:hypothetical protein
MIEGVVVFGNSLGILRLDNDGTVTLIRDDIKIRKIMGLNYTSKWW